MRLEHAIDVTIGKYCVVDISLDQRRVAGKTTWIDPAVPIEFLGVILITIFPVLFTVAGEKVA